VREWLNQNPKVVIVIAAASLSILLGIVVELVIPTNGYRAKDYEKEWLYNLNTGELFTADIGRFKITPTPASGEPAVAKAYVFSYAYEPNESEPRTSRPATPSDDGDGGNLFEGWMTNSGCRVIANREGQSWRRFSFLIRTGRPPVIADPNKAISRSKLPFSHLCKVFFQAA